MTETQTAPIKTNLVDSSKKVFREDNPLRNNYLWFIGLFGAGLIISTIGVTLSITRLVNFSPATINTGWVDKVSPSGPILGLMVIGITLIFTSCFILPTVLNIRLMVSATAALGTLMLSTLLLVDSRVITFEQWAMERYDVSFDQPLVEKVYTIGAYNSNQVYIVHRDEEGIKIYDAHIRGRELPLSSEAAK